MTIDNDYDRFYIEEDIPPYDLSGHCHSHKSLSKKLKLNALDAVFLHQVGEFGVVVVDGSEAIGDDADLFGGIKRNQVFGSLVNAIIGCDTANVNALKVFELFDGSAKFLSTVFVLEDAEFLLVSEVALLHVMDVQSVVALHEVIQNFL